MENKKHYLFPILFLLVSLLILSAQAVQAQTGGGYDLTWNTQDGGGVINSTGGAYSMSGTVGQPDIGTITGGGYNLAGGFWTGVPPFNIYLPTTIR